MRTWPLRKVYPVAVVVSLALHAWFFGHLGKKVAAPAEHGRDEVKVRVVGAEPARPSEPRAAPRPKAQKKVPQQESQSLPHETENTGASDEPAAASGGTASGNEGGADRSSDPQLIRDSIVAPSYTDAALAANLEGYVVVEVAVDDQGNVTDAKLANKIGYNMDERLLNAARQARFVPRKNALGQPEAGRTTIKFNMQIP